MRGCYRLYLRSLKVKIYDKSSQFSGYHLAKDFSLLRKVVFIILFTSKFHRGPSVAFGSKLHEIFIKRFCGLRIPTRKFPVETLHCEENFQNLFKVSFSKPKAFSKTNRKASNVSSAMQRDIITEQTSRKKQNFKLEFL